jgi:hypothetical protein
MGTALRPGGLYRGVDGLWHDANGHVVAGPTAAEKKAAVDYENTLWEREQMLQAIGTQRVIMHEAQPQARPEMRDLDEWEPTDAVFNQPIYAPATDADADLDLTGEEQEQIKAIKQAARERQQREAEESAKALAARREEVLKEAQADAEKRSATARPQARPTTRPNASGVSEPVGIPTNAPDSGLKTPKGGA